MPTKAQILSTFPFSGGTTGQALVKTDETDYNWQWGDGGATPPPSGVNDFTGTIGGAEGIIMTVNETGSLPPVQFDPEGDPKKIYVTRAEGGFNPDGSARVVQDEITIMQRVRQLWPSNQSLTTADVSLGSSVYVGDVLDDITNLSTRVVEPVLSAWITHGDQCLDGNSDLVLQWIASHKFGRDGVMLANSEATLTDGSTVVTSGALQEMSGRYVSATTGLHAPCYEWTVPAATIASLNLGEITIDVIHRPHYGRQWQASVDAVRQAYHGPDSPYPDAVLRMERISAFRYYGINADGQTGTPGQQTTRAAALSNAYGGVDAMAAAMAAAIADGGPTGAVLVVADSTATVNYSTGWGGATMGIGAGYLVGETPGTMTKVMGLAATATNGIAGKFIMEDIQFQSRQAGNSTQFANRSNNASPQASKSMAFIRSWCDPNGFGNNNAIFGNCGRTKIIESDLEAFVSFNDGDAQFAHLIGSKGRGCGGSNVFGSIATIHGANAGLDLKNNTGWDDAGKTAKTDGLIFWFSELKGNGGANAMNADSLFYEVGVHFVGCVGDYVNETKAMFEAGTAYPQRQLNNWFSHCSFTSTPIGGDYCNEGEKADNHYGHLMWNYCVLYNMNGQNDTDTKSGGTGPSSTRDQWMFGQYWVDSEGVVFLDPAGVKIGDEASKDMAWLGYRNVEGASAAAPITITRDGGTNGFNDGVTDYRIATGRVHMPTVPSHRLQVPIDIDGVALIADTAISGAVQTVG